MYTCIVSEIFFWRQDKLHLPAINFQCVKDKIICSFVLVATYTFEYSCISWKVPTLLFLYKLKGT